MKALGSGSAPVLLSGSGLRLWHAKRKRLQGNRVKFTQKVNLTLRFPHISSCEIKRLVGQAVEEGARMGHASR
ncbi:hypothetical protein [Xanthomonas citri]|uniref:hypothetical protein n=1 Tax=Xanthomonas citri TaxID=346 RepID=UPI0005D836D0|nr:hypothetical protein [Xanthomonas citri]AJY97706.1 hypothetical protein J164_04462 [Xanthomonas citri pv. citri]